MALIYKLLGRDDWARLQAQGQWAGSAVDLADGYVHLSAADQVQETAGRHFAGRNDLILLAVDGAALGEALRWEPSRGGALFPHLYAPLPLAAVRSDRTLALGPDGAPVVEPLEG